MGKVPKDRRGMARPSKEGGEPKLPSPGRLPRQALGCKVLRGLGERMQLSRGRSDRCAPALKTEALVMATLWGVERSPPAGGRMGS